MRRASSRITSTLTPRKSPLSASFAVNKALLRFIPARSLPVGASSEGAAPVADAEVTLAMSGGASRAAKDVNIASPWDTVTIATAATAGLQRTPEGHG